MFSRGFKKQAALGIRVPKPHVDPITVRDAVGATQAKPFSRSIYRFGSGHHPRAGLKAMSGVRRVN